MCQRGGSSSPLAGGRACRGNSPRAAAKANLAASWRGSARPGMGTAGQRRGTALPRSAHTSAQRASPTRWQEAAAGPGGSSSLAPDELGRVKGRCVNHQVIRCDGASPGPGTATRSAGAAHGSSCPACCRAPAPARESRGGNRAAAALTAAPRRGEQRDTDSA